MSITRQPKIRTLSVRFSPGHRIDWHSHTWSQLVYATDGVMTFESEQCRWIVPAGRAIWVPGGHQHRVEMHGSVFMQTIYVQQDLSQFGLVDCCVVNVSYLLHELIVHVCERGIINADSVENRTLIQFVSHQLRKLSIVPLSLTMPADERAHRFARLVLAKPGARTSLSELASRSGTSVRTLQRLFQAEVGMAVSKWRNQVRMLTAVELLAKKQSVTTVAFDLGFESPSAFIHAFKQCFGETPGRYHSR